MERERDTLQHYFGGLRDIPLLTPEEEVDLARRIEAGRTAERRLAAARTDPAAAAADRAELEARAQAGRAAFERFVTANLRLVVREAVRQARRSPLETSEAVQEGNLGLIRAVEGFDWRRGLRFSTYATWWIRQSIQRGIANKERAIRLPTRVHHQLLKVRAAQTRLVGELGRPPCLDELAVATDLSEKEVRHALEADHAVASLDAPLAADSDDGAVLAALVARAADNPAEEVVERMFARGVVDTAREHLPPRAWHVLRRRYGLDGEEPATLQRVGDEIGMTREGVRRAEQRALAQLRQALDSHELAGAGAAR